MYHNFVSWNDENTKMLSYHTLQSVDHYDPQCHSTPRQSEWSWCSRSSCGTLTCIRGSRSGVVAVLWYPPHVWNTSHRGHRSVWTYSGRPQGNPLGKVGPLENMLNISMPERSGHHLAKDSERFSCKKFLLSWFKFPRSVLLKIQIHLFIITIHPQGTLGNMSTLV